MKHKVLIAIGGLVGCFALLILIEYLIILNTGEPVPPPDTPRSAEYYGTPTDKALSYVVMGDSTSVGQGGNYDKGIARSTARQLGTEHYVTFHNVGVSGATAADVAARQLPTAVGFKPDIVLLAVTANDVRKFRPIGSVKAELTQTIDGLRAVNPAVVIVLTGSPQMGSIPRFPQPSRAVFGLRTAAMNKMITTLSTDKHVSFSRIADRTGPTFSTHPELFAPDKFHPNTQGYDLWVAVLQETFKTAVQ